MEQIASKFRQLTRTVQRVWLTVRNIVLTVAMLFGMQIQHKLRQCAVHASNLPFHYHKAGTSQLNQLQSRGQSAFHPASRGHELQSQTHAGYPSG